MALPQGHVLSNLKEQDGFKIKEAVKVEDWLKTEQLCEPTEFSISADDIPLIVDSGSLKGRPLTAAEIQVLRGPRPLREVIPYTEGRALGWKIKEHLLSAKARNWPGIKPFEFDGQTIAICGGAPSLGHNLHTLRALQRRGAKVMTINRTQDYLLGLPNTHNVPWIKPWASIILEPTPRAAEYAKPINGIRYYISSQCAPQTFDKFEGLEHYIWHAESKPELSQNLTPDERRVMVPAMGSTCGLRAMFMAYMMGFRDIHLFGLDSCYASHDIKNAIWRNGGKPTLHSYDKPETIHDFKEVIAKGFPEGDRTYFGNGNMLSQGDEFHKFMCLREEKLKAGRMDPHNIIVHGEGLIPDIARMFDAHTDQFNQERKAA